MLVWTNLHGGFVIGLGVIFIYAAAGVLARERVALMFCRRGLRGGDADQSLRIGLLALPDSGPAASAPAHPGVASAAAAGVGRFLGVPAFIRLDDHRASRPGGNAWSGKTGPVWRCWR
jgi:hypothetical protein